MANRRYVHPGQSQVIGRDRRDYKAMNTATAGISVAGFDTAPRQHAADGSAKEAKKTFKDLRGVVRSMVKTVTDFASETTLRRSRRSSSI